MSVRTILFSSEHVSEGHPDKLCDQVSDAVLDACLAKDPNSKVACETASKTGMIMVFGEITTKTVLDYQKIVRDAVKDIGFDDGKKGLDYKTLNLLVAIEQQSPEIYQSVWGADDKKSEEDLGAGDQGMMFGYATDETACLMPLTYELARNLCKKCSELRRSGDEQALRARHARRRQAYPPVPGAHRGIRRRRTTGGLGCVHAVGRSGFPVRQCHIR